MYLKLNCPTRSFWNVLSQFSCQWTSKGSRWWSIELRWRSVLSARGSSTEKVRLSLQRNTLPLRTLTVEGGEAGGVIRAGTDPAVVGNGISSVAASAFRSPADVLGASGGTSPASCQHLLYHFCEKGLDENNMHTLRHTFWCHYSHSPRII